MTSKGNALFLILVAVALFAALSYAITLSGRSGGGIEKEQARINQAIMDNYIAELNSARMRLSLINKCPAIDYTPPEHQTAGGDKSCFMYHPDGGRVAYNDLDSCEERDDGSMENLGIGESCGGLIYVGVINGNRIYTNFSNITAQWSVATTTTGATSTNDGLANTEALLGLSDTTYPMAEACRTFGPKWYVPAIDELQLLYDNRTAGSLNGTMPITTPATWYVSSTEYDTTKVWMQLFSAAGGAGQYSKNYNFPTRCVRRD